MSDYDLAVIGEGIAGLACAGKAARRGLSVATFESNIFGGLVVNVSALQGYSAGIPGVELASTMAETNASLGVESLGVGVSALHVDGGSFTLATDAGQIRASAVVLATGASHRPLGVPGEARLEHRGVSHCADCDGPIFSGKPVVAVGGGDGAFMQAAVLANYASEVTVVLRSETPRARSSFRDAAASNDRIRILTHTKVLEICGDEEVAGIRVETGDGSDRLIPCSGVFVYAGLEPNADLVRSLVNQASTGAVGTDERFETTLPGLFAIGAVRAGYSGRLEDAIRESELAADHATDHVTALARSRSGRSP